MSNTIYHWHHIIPRHAGGTDDPSNLIRLTIEEHAEAHRVLWEQHGRIQDKLAWLMLSGKTQEGEVAQRELFRSPEHRAKISAAVKGKNIGEKNPMFGRTGEKNPFHGKKHSDEQRAKWSISKSGENGPMYGKSHSTESLAKIRESKLGEKNPMYGKTGKNAPNYGKSPSDEQRAKIREALLGPKSPNYGKKFSPETRAKMSAAKKRCDRMKRIAAPEVTIHVG